MAVDGQQMEQLLADLADPLMSAADIFTSNDTVKTEVLLDANSTVDYFGNNDLGSFLAGLNDSSTSYLIPPTTSVVPSTETNCYNNLLPQAGMMTSAASDTTLSTSPEAVVPTQQTSSHGHHLRQRKAARSYASMISMDSTSEEGSPPPPPVDGHDSDTSSQQSSDIDGKKGSSATNKRVMKRPTFKQQEPRKRWKCSAQFLLDSITTREREQLKKVGITAPPSGETKISKQQEKELRQALRKIRNVASAQKSRRAQKEYIGTLEQQMEEVTERNEQLERKIENLASDNNTLRDQLAELRKMIYGSATGAGIPLFMIAACCAVLVGPTSIGSSIMSSSSSAASSLAPNSFQARTLQSVENDNNVTLCLMCLGLKTLLLAGFWYMARRSSKLQWIGAQVCTYVSIIMEVIQDQFSWVSTSYYTSQNTNPTYESVIPKLH